MFMTKALARLTIFAGLMALPVNPHRSLCAADRNDRGH